jgi:extracellular factor (EF) 3-hydroxypalmitic acid methyl ester biosynthesis protein
MCQAFPDTPFNATPRPPPMATQRNTNLVASNRDILISCRNSQGAEVRATPLRMTRHLVVFEVYNPFSIVQLSEVLSDFRIVMNDRLVYSGRAVVSSLVNTGILLVCEVTLDEAWLDVDIFSPVTQRDRLREEFETFIGEWARVQTIQPDFKIVVADMETLLVDLRRWLEQVELSIRSTPSGDRETIERDVLTDLAPPMLPTISDLIGRFEGVVHTIPAEQQPVHRTYIKRQIHPLVLCSPFAWRTYSKPLGYAGDYEMVNMILRNPFEGASLFAKMLNAWFLSEAPSEAHRNRVVYLTGLLRQETRRTQAAGRRCRVFNLGCGPAGEVQNFLRDDGLCDQADLTLLDFNDETIEHTRRLLGDLKTRHGRQMGLRTVKRSVHQILKEGIHLGAGETGYDFIYCAGLFDYLSERICKRLMNIFYEMLAPGGLLVATNVDVSNPFRNTMEYVLEWHLIYRDAAALAALTPDNAPPGASQVQADKTGVNIYLEVRKPSLGPV